MILSAFSSGAMLWQATGSSRCQMANLLCSSSLLSSFSSPLSEVSHSSSVCLLSLTVNISSFHLLNLLFLYSAFLSLPVYTPRSLIFIHCPISLILLFLFSVHSILSFYSVSSAVSVVFFLLQVGHMKISNHPAPMWRLTETQGLPSTSFRHLFQSLPFLCSVLLCPQFTFRETFWSHPAATVVDKKRLAGFLAIGDYSLV